MNQKTDLIETPRVTASDLEAARVLLKKSHSEGWAALNVLFRDGKLPDPVPNGRYHGELLALDIAPGLTQTFQWLANLWMPWRGKSFDASQQRGENILTKDSYLLARFFNPLYQGFVTDTSDTYRAFAFRTYTAPGLVDPDRMVLKIDYNLKENPAFTVRRVLDELVQIDNDIYLGKAHVHWWWRPKGAWQTVAFFSLAGDKNAL